VAFEEPAHARCGVDVVDGGGEARPGAGVLRKLRVASLEENLDAVEGAHYCFGLEKHVSIFHLEVCRLTYSTPSKPARQPTLHQIFRTLLVHLLLPVPDIGCSLFLGEHGGIMVGYYVAWAVCLRRSRGHIRFASVITEEIRGHSRLCVRLPRHGAFTVEIVAKYPRG
jgi:hypothetical protein